MSVSKPLVSLSECQPGNRLIIKQIKIEGVLRRRLLDLGFVKDAEIHVLLKSPLGDPVAYRVSETTIALRLEESKQIFGELIEEE